MADSSQPLILEALSRAVAEPAGLPLLGSKAAPGLFARSAAGRSAAQACKEQGLIQAVGSETHGKTTREVCAITEKGLALLLRQANPRDALEAFVAALHARQEQADQLLASAHDSRRHLETLRLHAEKVLLQLQQRPPAPAPLPAEKNGSGRHDGDISGALLAHLKLWLEGHALEDCPLPELFRGVKARHAGLSIGQFHDALRRLREQRLIYLHPWTGPLHELPEPALALLAGHEIAHYASLQGMT